MTTNLRVNSDSCKSTWTLHLYDLHEFESMATRTNEHGLVLVLVLVYVWIGPESSCVISDSYISFSLPPVTFMYLLTWSVCTWLCV